MGTSAFIEAAALYRRRILADVIVEEFESGSPIEEIHENYPKLTEDTIRDLISFARPQASASSVRPDLRDENLPHKLRLHLPNHDVKTVAFVGLDGLKNGELLKAAEDAGFEVFVTADRALAHQQNMAGRRIAVVALSGQIWSLIKVHLERISETITQARPGTITRLDCGVFSWRAPRSGGPTLPQVRIFHNRDFPCKRPSGRHGVQPQYGSLLY